jgi:cell division protein FtsB
MEKLGMRTALLGCVTSLFLAGTGRVGAADVQSMSDQILQLQKQNEALQEQLRKQQELIDSLSHKVSEIQNLNATHDREISDLKAEKEGSEAHAQSNKLLRLGKVQLGGEGGVAFFHSESKGSTPNAEFRIDEAKLFVDAPIWDNVYLFGEINLASREETDLNVRLGQLYLDWENISQLWGQDRELNLRLGRFYIPFGEEYIYRYAIDNPLISHSLSDIWGVDEGVELYGSVKKFSYAVAVQNGGIATTRDFNADKSVAGRVGYDATKWLYMSVSGMRTGDLDAQNDVLSELWFGSAWIRRIGSPGTTRFHANLVEGDVQLNWPGFHIWGAGGYVNYEDNDPLGRNQRDVYYYYVEGVKDITRKFYSAARFSQALAADGFPIAGNGTIHSYFADPLTTEYWRLSLGLGYRFSPNLVAKGEYSFNQGKRVDGEKRTDENVFALEAAFRF